MPLYHSTAGLVAVLAVFGSSACRADGETVSKRGVDEVPSKVGALTGTDVTGAWSVVIGDANTKCVLALSNLANRPALGEGCVGTPLEAARSWRLSGVTFEVLDGGGRPIARFRQTGMDSFEAISPPAAGSSLRLTRAPAT